jgi:hypothetical protein
MKLRNIGIVLPTELFWVGYHCREITHMYQKKGTENKEGKNEKQRKEISKE